MKVSFAVIAALFASFNAHADESNVLGMDVLCLPPGGAEIYSIHLVSTSEGTTITKDGKTYTAGTIGHQIDRLPRSHLVINAQAMRLSLYGFDMTKLLERQSQSIDRAVFEADAKFDYAGDQHSVVCKGKIGWLE